MRCPYPTEKRNSRLRNAQSPVLWEESLSAGRAEEIGPDQRQIPQKREKGLGGFSRIAGRTLAGGADGVLLLGVRV